MVAYACSLAMNEDFFLTHEKALIFFFLFILCAFHIMHLNPIHFPIPSHLPSASATLTPK